ncbi:MAG: hypothetical protein GQ536_07890 [Candidatus Aminicenantes bacterium]|nr:hypothetical protein [Candidatus Aminicenantes bacterium]
MKKSSSLVSSRRQFLTNALPAGTLLCFGGSRLLASQLSDDNQQELKFGDRIKEEYCKSHEDAWRWRFGLYIHTMESLAEYLGRDKLLELLKKIKDDGIKRESTINPEHILANLARRYKDKDHYKNTLTYRIIEESEKAFELRITECLWAKTFLEKDAGDIGYLTICYGDLTSAKAYNPKLKLRLTKTLMQGFDCCNHRYTLGG